MTLERREGLFSEIDHSSKFKKLFLDRQMIEEISCIRQIRNFRQRDLPEQLVYLATDISHINKILTKEEIAQEFDYVKMTPNSVSQNIRTNLYYARKRYFDNTSSAWSDYELNMIHNVGLILTPKSNSLFVELPVVMPKISSVFTIFPEWWQPFLAVNQRYEKSRNRASLNPVVSTRERACLDRLLQNRMESRPTTCPPQYANSLVRNARKAGVEIKLEGRPEEERYNLLDVRMIN